MKNFIFYLATLLTLPVAGNALAQSENPASYDSAQAEAVMNRYFAALVGGDVATLKTVLGGRLKAKRKPLLNNPEYAGYIATTHVDASFQILGMRNTAPDTVSVDVLVSFGPDESIHKTYTLRRDASDNAAAPYRIVSEQTVAD